MCRAHDHCNWAHLQLRRARNHKFRAHFNCNWRRDLAGQENEGFSSHTGKPGRKHLLLHFARSIRLQRLFEQGSYFTGFYAQHFRQNGSRLPVPGERRLKIVDLFGQDEFQQSPR